MRTRRALCEALMAELATTPLNRITVSHLSKVTGISRQGFYYHFADVYALAVWNFKTEVTDRVKTYATYASWVKCVTLMLDWMREHKTECYRVIEAMPTGEFEQFLFGELRELMVCVLEDLEPSIGAEDLGVSREDRDFIIDHFTLSVQGHIMHWVAQDMEADPHVFVPRVQRILRGSVARALREFSNPENES